MFLTEAANRGSISTGYDIDNSCKFEKNNDTSTVEFFERNVSSTGNRDVGTFSAWIKKTDVTTAQYLFTFGNTDNDNGRTYARFNTDSTMSIGGGSTYWRKTNRVFRDTSAWYHIVIAFDTTQSTANDRIKLYVNGVQETSFSTTNNPSQNDDLGLNFEKQAIGYNTIDNNSGFNGYMAEVLIQDGTASAPTEFGEFDDDSGVWKPKDLSAISVGTNGTYLKFENSASMGAATSGNAFTVQNINQNDQATDTPTNNFATINAINLSGTGITLSNGATKMTNSSTWQTGVSTIAVTKGKWYFEAKASSASSFVGFVDVEDVYVPINSTGYYLGYAGGNQNRSVAMGGDGNIYNDNNSASGTTFGSSNIVGMALDMDDRKVYWYVDNSIVNSGTAVTWATSSTLGDAWTDVITLAVSLYSGVTMEVNFGGYTTMSISSGASDANGYGTFEYAPPSGYYALCSKNLAEYG